MKIVPEPRLGLLIRVLPVTYRLYDFLSPLTTFPLCASLHHVLTISVAV